MGRPVRRIKRGADVVLEEDWLEEGNVVDCVSLSACMLRGEYEFLERNEISLAVDDSRSIDQFADLFKLVLFNLPTPAPTMASSAPSPHSISSTPISLATTLTVVVFPAPAGPDNNKILCTVSLSLQCGVENYLVFPDLLDGIRLRPVFV